MLKPHRPDFPTPTRVKAAPTYFSHTDMGYSRTDLLFPHRHVLELCRTDLNEIWQRLGGSVRLVRSVRSVRSVPFSETGFILN
jgi:hypothetical protein